MAGAPARGAAFLRGLHAVALGSAALYTLVAVACVLLIPPPARYGGLGR